MRRGLIACVSAVALVAAGFSVAVALADGVPSLPSHTTGTTGGLLQQLTGLLPSVPAQTISTPSVQLNPPTPLPQVSVPAQTVVTPPLAVPSAPLPILPVPPPPLPTVSLPAVPAPAKTATSAADVPARVAPPAAPTTAVPPTALLPTTVPPTTTVEPPPSTTTTTGTPPASETTTGSTLKTTPVPTSRPHTRAYRPHPRARTRPAVPSATTGGGAAAAAPRIHTLSPAARAAAPRRQGVGGNPTARRDVIVRLVKAIPATIWILVAVLGGAAFLFAFGMIAAAYSRRALARQRAALLDDVDLLQRALLPSPAPRIGPVAVSAAFAPADGLAAGGDFYDIFELEDGRVVAFLGDICGHGRVAVEKAALARFTLRTLLARGGTLAAAFEEADRQLAHDLGGLFATAIAVRISADGCQAETVSAGHEPPIRLGGEDPPLDTGPALGLNLGLVGWPEAGFQLGEGEALVLFSDGLIESRLTDGSQIGRGGLLKLVASARSADEVLEHLQQLATVDDDLACLTITR